MAERWLETIWPHVQEENTAGQSHFITSYDVPGRQSTYSSPDAHGAVIMRKLWDKKYFIVNFLKNEIK